MLNQTLLKVSIIIQFSCLLGIIGAAHYFATMSSTNMGWIFFLPLWGFPSFFQVMFILRDLFVIPMKNRILVIKKFYLFLILPYILFYGFVVVPVLTRLFPYPVWNDDKLSGIGQYVLYFFFVLPYFTYLFLCLWQLKQEKSISEELFQKLKD